MDRKEFLGSLLAPPYKKKTVSPVQPKVEKAPAAAPPLVLQSGINPYAGSWTENEVIHLLKRLQFGAPKEEVDYFKTLTYPQAVDLLLNTTNPNPGGPIKTYTPSTDTNQVPINDPDYAVPLGKTWVNNQSANGNVNAFRQPSVKYWWLDLMINQPRGIEEKMILFWSTHFAIEFDTVANGVYLYRYLQTLRKYCTGNFKEFTKAVTLEVSMLTYLNGQLNSKTAPDENYGRELQELFTLGKGPGSQYTEGDVKAAARVLTGYRITAATATFNFDLTRHDTNDKVFSDFYGNTKITGGTTAATAQAELDAMLNMIFAKEEAAKYICRRIYRFFVYGSISDDVENNIIAPMAAAFRANYDIKTALSLLFKSEHFFDVLTQGAMIKSPLDFIVGQIREFKLRFPPASNAVLYYKMMALFTGNSSTMDQNLGDPPNVSGWAAYYQDPIYDKSWLSTDTYAKRLTHTNTLITGYTNTNQTLRIDWIGFAKRMTDPGDPNKLVSDFATYLLRMPLSQESRDRIKSQTLLTGQTSDYYWTNAWTAYIATPQNASAFSDVNTRLQNLCKYFLNLEEYQLM